MTQETVSCLPKHPSLLRIGEGVKCIFEQREYCQMRSRASLRWINFFNDLESWWLLALTHLSYQVVEWDFPPIFEMCACQSGRVMRNLFRFWRIPTLRRVISLRYVLENEVERWYSWWTMDEFHILLSDFYLCKSSTGFKQSYIFLAIFIILIHSISKIQLEKI